MGNIKSLAKDTAIYGLSSIVGKTLNWLLTPLFTYTLNPSQFGVITNLYAYVALLIVILTFGMETGLFRFANLKDKYNPQTVYSTTLIAIGSFVLFFLFLATVFLNQVTYFTPAGISKYYVYLMILVLSMDAFSCIPFAYLRYKQRPLKFAALKMLFVVLYIGLCVFFLLICPKIYKSNPSLISWFYVPDLGVLYILISNLIATSIQTLFLIPQLTGFKYTFDWSLLKKMLKYCYPLVILGIAGILSQTIDKIMFPVRYSDSGEAMHQLGIYGACFKIGVIMVMFTQAFRYAYEPFIFARSTGSDSKKAYSDAMKYFIILGLLIFLGVMFYIDIIKYFINPEYFDGLKVVPLVMLAELFFGIYFNLSLWYKLTDQTYWGAIFSIAGCVIIVLINYFFIPVYGYMACAFASLIAYFLIMVISYFIGQKKFPIVYELKRIGLYFFLAFVLYTLSVLFYADNQIYRLSFNTLLLFIYIWVVIKFDLPLKDIPFISRFIKK